MVDQHGRVVCCSTGSVSPPIRFPSSPCSWGGTLFFLQRLSPCWLGGCDCRRGCGGAGGAGQLRERGEGVKGQMRKVKGGHRSYKAVLIECSHCGENDCNRRAKEDLMMSPKCCSLGRLQIGSSLVGLL